MRRTLASLAVLLTAVMASPPAQSTTQSTTRSTTRSTTQPVTQAAKGHPRALFFGDSYFVGGGCSPDAKQDMAYLAGTLLGYRTTVRGAGGTGFVAANPDYHLPPYLAQIHQGALTVKNPQLVVVEGGSNDLTFPVAQIKKNATKVLHIAQHKYPRTLVVLVGPMDPYGGYDDTAPVRDALARVATKVGVPFIDDMTWLQEQPGMLCDDYDHPTYAAGVTLGKRLARALRHLGA